MASPHSTVLETGTTLPSFPTVMDHSHPSGNGDASAINGELGSRRKFKIVLTFDVEEHYRIEAASALKVDNGLRSHYRQRLGVSTGWLLDRLAERHITATFFVVGKIAKHNPGLIRAIHQAGHEVASHSWDHQRVHNFTPKTFRDDVRRSKDSLEQLIGEKVVGYRAPTFSIVRETAWAIDVLAEMGFQYDSSIFPIVHDRYGVPRAPRVPFLAQGNERTIVELPPTTLRLMRTNIPVAGGGYFRLLPLLLMKLAFWQIGRHKQAPVAMLYFHPWEFDPEQARLPLRRISRFRTYVGLFKNQDRLESFLERKEFVQARGIAGWLNGQANSLFKFHIGETNGKH